MGERVDARQLIKLYLAIGFEWYIGVAYVRSGTSNNTPSECPELSDRKSSFVPQ